jgi:hypothetical protein
VSDTIGLNMGATITQPQGVFPRIDKNW